ncbi:hypothetical protein EDD90_10097 [Streptomyces sp. Ag109_O5-1]|uniref:hypothetical protein n=1 Tax=Streptomyces sp. Ag109_O5-1 TaxID=1938851 RepID=UPI000F4E79BE|nr:hypothetical protein [Streptomyces sp. Ag109_O5-1]RPE46735.1 hypothetical protein EDD90_10097 [Streptomyces sp. Ag109_O5-1]
MGTYGDSIYGTSGSPFASSRPGARAPRRAAAVRHVFTWPIDGVLRIPEVYNTISGIYLLNAPSTCQRHDSRPARGRVPAVSANGDKALEHGNVTTEGSAVIQSTSNSGTPQQWAMTGIG